MHVELSLYGQKAAPPPQSSLRNDYSTAIRRGEAFRTQDAKTMERHEPSSVRRAVRPVLPCILRRCCARTPAVTPSTTNTQSQRHICSSYPSAPCRKRLQPDAYREARRRTPCCADCATICPVLVPQSAAAISAWTGEDAGQATFIVHVRSPAQERHARSARWSAERHPAPRGRPAQGQPPAPSLSPDNTKPGSFAPPADHSGKSGHALGERLKANSPSRPEPSSKKVDGSGTGAVPAPLALIIQFPA